MVGVVDGIGMQGFGGLEHVRGAPGRHSRDHGNDRGIVFVFVMGAVFQLPGRGSTQGKAEGEEW